MRPNEPFNIQAWQAKTARQLEDLAEKVLAGEVKGAIILWQEPTDETMLERQGAHVVLAMQPRENPFTWIGQLELVKTDILHRVMAANA